MKALKKRHTLTLNKVNHFKGFGTPFPVTKKENKSTPDLFRVEFIHVLPNEEELYFSPQWYQLRHFSSEEKTNLLAGVKTYLKDENVSIEQSFIFLAIALRLDQYRRQDFRNGDEFLPNSAFIYPAVKDKDEIIRYPIAHFINKGEFYLGEKEDKLLAFAINKTVFTNDKLEVLN
jgi:hypothetical protein